MADIYPDEGSSGVIDIGKARDALKLSAGMNDAQRRTHVAEITAAAMLDIAASLRPIGAEAASALNWASTTEEPDIAAAQRIGETIEDRGDFLVIGDLVVVDGNDEPGEVRGFGNDQGEITVDVAFANGADGRYFLANVHRLVGNDRDDDTMREAAEASGDDRTPDEVGHDEAFGELAKLNAAADAEGEIDDDFDAPATALDALKAKSKKKGKKA